MSQFADRVVLVTGGGAGIGRATVDALAAQRAAVAVIERDAERAADVEQALGAAGVAALVIRGDVTDDAAVAGAAEAIAARFGRLDALVNNVGDFLGVVKPFGDATDGDISRLYDTNLRQVFVVTRAMLPLLRKGRDASIVSVSSIEGFRAIPMCTVYATFKAALTGFTKSLGVELGPERIRVNLVAPETTETPQVPVHAMLPAAHRDHVDRWIPLGRFGAPEDIASAILFLAGPGAGWITGTTIHVDGGALAAAGWYRDPQGLWTNLPVVTDNGLGFRLG